MGSVQTQPPVWSFRFYVELTDDNGSIDEDRAPGIVWRQPSPYYSFNRDPKRRCRTRALLMCIEALQAHRLGGLRGRRCTAWYTRLTRTLRSLNGGVLLCND
jgi:hypothetical protein